MATVTGYTAGKTREELDKTIVGGTVDQNTKHLILEQAGGGTVDAGKIDGPKGDKGDPGMGNVNTVNAKFGPDIVLNAGDVGALPATTEASESVFGATRLATNAEALAGTSDARTVTPKKLLTVAEARWEKKASTLFALGTGLYAGQLALLTLASDTFPVEVVWTGARWEPVSWRLSGSQFQRDAFQASGVCFDGVEWYNTTYNTTEVRLGTAWTNNTSGLVPITNYQFLVNASLPYEGDAVLSPNTIRVQGIYQVRLTNLFTPLYSNYRIILLIHNCSSTAANDLRMQFVNNAGSTVNTAAYNYIGEGLVLSEIAASRTVYKAYSTTFMVINRLSSSVPGRMFSIMDVLGPANSFRSSVDVKSMGYEQVASVPNQGAASVNIQGGYNSSAAMQGLLLTTGNSGVSMDIEIAAYGYN